MPPSRFHRRQARPWGRLTLNKACLSGLLWALIFLVIAGQVYVLLFLHPGDVEAAPRHRIRVFYTVFAHDDADPATLADLRALVDEQLAPLLPEHDVRVRAVGRPPDLPPAAQLARYNAVGTDLETLDMLWEFCAEAGREGQRVAYLHSLGSSGSPRAPGSRGPAGDARLRRFATRGALSRTCAAAPACDVCAARVSPVPRLHAPGNMWLARCEYVRRLPRPSDFELTTDVAAVGQDWSRCLGLEMFAAAHWVVSDPGVRACDLSPSPYAWGDEGVPEWGPDEAEFDLRRAPRFAMGQYSATC